MTPRKPKPERIDDDAPEVTAAWFKRARPAKGVLKELVSTTAGTELLKPRRGRSPIAGPKVAGRQ